METLKIRYLSDKIEKLRFIDGKSDWIDLRSAEWHTFCDWIETLPYAEQLITFEP